MTRQLGDLEPSSRGAPGGDGAAGGGARGWRPLTIAMVGQKGLPATMGGVERHVEEVGSRLASRGHEVLVFCRSSYGSSAHQSYRGMTLLEAPTIATKHLDAIVHSAASTWGRWLGGQTSCTTTHSVRASMAPVPRYLSRAAVVMTVHGLDHQRDKWGAPARAVLGAAHWMSGRVPHGTVVVSRDSGCALRRALPQGRGVHPQRGPDTRAHRRQRLRAVDRPRPWCVRLVRRPSRSREAPGPAHPGPCWRATASASWRSSGTRPSRDEYSRRLRELAGDDPRIVFPGFVGGAHLEEVFQRAGVFVQPSDLEGLPLTLLEAVANGAPVLASDIAPHLEIIGAGSPAHRVFARGDVDSLRTALEQMLAGVPVRSG